MGNLPDLRVRDDDSLASVSDIDDDEFDDTESVKLPSDEVVEDLEDHMQSLGEAADDDESYQGISDHRWNVGALELRVDRAGDSHSWLPWLIVRGDYPMDVANYIIKNKVGCQTGTYRTGRHSRWARKFKRDCQRVVRRVLHIHGILPISSM